MKRGDVVLVRFPHPSGLRGKKRPAVIVQSDSYATLVNTLIVAEVTSNFTMASDPACLLIDFTTPDGQATGVVRDCVVSCLVLVTVYSDTVVQTLGTLSPAMQAKLDNCLKAAISLHYLENPLAWHGVSLLETRSQNPSMHRNRSNTPAVCSTAGV